MRIKGEKNPKKRVRYVFTHMCQQIVGRFVNYYSEVDYQDASYFELETIQSSFKEILLIEI